MKTNNSLGKLILFIILTCSIGCQGPLYRQWHKPAADENETKKALLECGASNPIHSAVGKRNEIESWNNFSSVYICMVASGFSYIESKRLFALIPIHKNQIGVCAPRHFPKAELCNNIVTRNVERRLDSNYCKTREPTPPECLP